MGEITNTFVTVSCDGPDCGKTATFASDQESAKQAFNENAWMNSIRTIITIDQRKFVYCSDECEAKSVGIGVHNKKVLVEPTGPNAAALAAQAAARAQQATAALKSGGPVTLG